jgi:hypothetical protein
VRRDTFTSGGFKAVYKFTLSEGCDTQGMQAVIERPWLYKVSLNGKAIHPAQNKWLDRDGQQQKPARAFPQETCARNGFSNEIFFLPLWKIICL